MGLAALLRFWGLDAGLPHLLTRPDEEVVLHQTRVPASGSMDLSHDVYQYGVYSSAYVFLSWAWAAGAHFVMKAVGAFPPGGYLATMDTAPWRILLVLRSLSASAGVLSVALLMVFARRELGRRAALIAGLILASSYLHVRESHSAKPDALLVLGVVVALGVMAPLARVPSFGRAAAVGVAVGLAMSMKYPAVLLLLPAWAMCVMGSEASGWRRIVPASAVVVGLFSAFAFLGSSPDLLFNEQTRMRVLSIVALVFPSLFPEASFPAKPPAVPQGVVSFEHPSSLWDGMRYYFGFALRWGAGLVSLVAVPVSLGWAFWSCRPIAIAAGVFGLGSVLLLGASLAVHSRYLTPIVPAIAIMIAGALVSLAARLPARRRWVVGLLALLVVAEPLYSSVAYDRLISKTDSRVLATEWLEENVPDGARVLMLGSVIWAWGEPQLPPGLKGVRVDPQPDVVAAAGVDWIVAHHHELFSSRVDPDVIARLVPPFELVYEIEPLSGSGEDTVYDPPDAYYVPMAGFHAVDRPGPQIRIYRRRDIETP